MVVFLEDKRKFNAVSQNIKYGYIRRKTGEMLGKTNLCPNF